MHTQRWLRLAALMLLLLSWGVPAFTPPALAQTSAGGVVSMRLSGPLNPIWQEMIKRGIQAAQMRGAQALVLELDTPGGDVSLMNALVEQMQASPVPLIVYVTPTGAMAASAGTLLTLAGGAAGMAPGTTIGAASPVGSQGEDIGTTMETKVKEVLKASVRNLTARRGEEAVTLAQEMIEDARAVTADEALQAGLIDAVAKDLPELLQKLDGLSVPVGGSQVTLSTAGALIAPLPATFLEQFLQLLTNPNLVFLLLSVGVQAILIEISTPGGWVAGFIGVVCISLAVFGLGILPVNWFGAIFLVMALVLFVLDIKAPTKGALTAAGVVVFIIGALVLFNSTPAPGAPRVSVPLVIGMGIFFGLSFALILAFALRARKLPVRVGQESLAGQVGVARGVLNPVGPVQLSSELWTARLENPDEVVPKGGRVRVLRVEGIELVVKKE